MSTIPAHVGNPGGSSYKTDDFYQKQPKPITLHPLSNYTIGIKLRLPGATSVKSSVKVNELVSFNKEHGLKRSCLFVVLCHIHGHPMVLTIRWADPKSKLQHARISLPGGSLEPKEDELMGAYRLLHERFDPWTRMDFLKIKLLKSKQDKIQKQKQRIIKLNAAKRKLDLEAKNAEAVSSTRKRKKQRRAEYWNELHEKEKQDSDAESDKSHQSSDDNDKEEKNDKAQKEGDDVEMKENGVADDNKNISDAKKNTKFSDIGIMQITEFDSELEENGRLKEPQEYLPEQQRFDIVSCIGRWWRPDPSSKLYPYLPAHVTKPSELVKVYMATLPADSRILQLPKNLGAIFPVQLYDLYKNSQPELQAVPAMVSQFNFQYADKSHDIIRQDPVVGKFVAKRRKAHIKCAKKQQQDQPRNGKNGGEASDTEAAHKGAAKDKATGHTKMDAIAV